MSEHTEQAALFDWAARMENRYPELISLHATPNGGHRHPKVAMSMKREGVRAGVPDIHLPVPKVVWVERDDRLLTTRQYHGLWVEMKDSKYRNHHDGGLSEEQLCWATLLTELGHCVRVCYTWEKAAEVITNYLEGNNP